MLLTPYASSIIMPTDSQANYIKLNSGGRYIRTAPYQQLVNDTPVQILFKERRLDYQAHPENVTQMKLLTRAIRHCSILTIGLDWESKNLNLSLDFVTFLLYDVNEGTSLYLTSLYLVSCSIFCLLRLHVSSEKHLNICASLPFYPPQLFVCFSLLYCSH